MFSPAFYDESLYEVFEEFSFAELLMINENQWAAGTAMVAQLGNIIAWMRSWLQDLCRAGNIMVWMRSWLQDLCQAGNIMAWLRPWLQNLCQAGNIIAWMRSWLQFYQLITNHSNVRGVNVPVLWGSMQPWWLNKSVCSHVCLGSASMLPKQVTMLAAVIGFCNHKPEGRYNVRGTGKEPQPWTRTKPKCLQLAS